ncbi:hypothetical protein VZT92_019926 [Zoarces viviparus]|uniref:Uncharacterized protein n=1 Tax=Zoarces viviparus TaxID=48416 RepID=A0AAW1EGX2_ZOAVI
MSHEVIQQGRKYDKRHRTRLPKDAADEGNVKMCDRDISVMRYNPQLPNLCRTGRGVRQVEGFSKDDRKHLDKKARGTPAGRSSGPVNCIHMSPEVIQHGRKYDKRHRTRLPKDAADEGNLKMCDRDISVMISNCPLLPIAHVHRQEEAKKVEKQELKKMQPTLISYSGTHAGNAHYSDENTK